MTSAETTPWTSFETTISDLERNGTNALQLLTTGAVPAVIFRNAFPADECRSLVEFLTDQELMYRSGDPRIDQRAIPAERVDRWTQQGLNPGQSTRRRIDIGTSLGNLGDNKERFLADSARTHALFQQLFRDRPNPIDVVYRSLQAIAPGRTVRTAREPGPEPGSWQEYGPAIFRIHYGGYTYGPHFDSVRLRENRSSYAVYRFEHQLAGVLCIQNSTLEGRSAQAIMHRQMWKPEIDPLLNNGQFSEYCREQQIENISVELEPGDLYFFNTGTIHEVPGVPGDEPRIVLATFIGTSDDDSEIMVWS